MNSSSNDAKDRPKKSRSSTFTPSGRSPDEPSGRPKKKPSSFKPVGKRPPELSGDERVERVPSGQARVYAATAGFVIGMTLGSLAYRFVGIAPFFPGDLMWVLAVVGIIVGYFPGPYWIDKAIHAGWWF